MDSQGFYLGIKTLSEWFGKKLSATQEDLIFKEIKFIPDRAWNDMIKTYTKRYKPTPSNFPTPEDIINQWYNWRKENPELVKKEFEPQPCEDCEGRGLFWYKYIYEPLAKIYEACVVCGACENWKQHFNIHHKLKVVRLAELKNDPLVQEIWPYETT